MTGSEPAPSYRAPVTDDAPALAELGRLSFIETFAHLYSKEDLEAFLAKNHSEGGWRAQIESSDHAIRVVENGSGLIAYAKLGPLELPAKPAGPAIELDQLYILGPWQGQGIAQQLMAWTLDEARRRGAQEIFLSVWSQNHRAQAFYRKYGFSFVKPHAFMVGEQADEDEIWRLALDE
jgi:diamine N-acetyltransferase